MFTGIIEDIGIVQSVNTGRNSMSICITSDLITEDVHLGDSISVNGVCLTVTSFTLNSFTVDVMPETFNATNIAQLRPGIRVNLERAMSAAGRFGGHFVSGHIDGTGLIMEKKRQANAVYYKIKAETGISDYCITKGSVAIDGTSLTIFDVTQDVLTISLIPHTLEQTVIGSKNEGEKVNIEVDMLGKYVISKLEKTKQAPTITSDFLTKNGF
ncbi:riboflavin synthase [Peribacillus psychrosaccharolyticus]|uniref:Riboflavin synthase n=1 Tax=Peribacillus psychrosaccharolyticus TaxID=1407 RepID=A0A974NQU3_PERPY|nr:riboflavin synthase [Peribacillus psychrosaccharolyticus]MEC2057072.1 riboflavin synthase [Peribacillus psychrosaccharolyticus]MED3744994.1 riboflavin synthase [Peribacillus psychrosaccharolyticus]QQT02390.1 riboflavin synthase [Peribacillus psychrosaccharolyticus]